MKIGDIVTVEDYETPRTAAEFKEWWNTRYREYGETREGVIYCREGKGFSKKFHEEAHPMCTFMTAYFPSSSIRCKLSAGNEPADAVLIDESGDIIKRIQITFAVDGRTEHLRSRELTRVGHVNALAKPVEFGSGRIRTVTFPTAEMTLHQDIVDEMILLVRARIESKSSMAYGTDFALVIGFNDHSLNPEDANDFLNLNVQITHSFSEIYLIGIHGNILVPIPSS